jgi:hypothetical protein
MESVASMIIHSKHVTLAGISLAWKPTCDLQVTTLFQPMQPFQNFIIFQIALNDVTIKFCFQCLGKPSDFFPQMPSFL